jgi:hypothetical protein
MAVLRVTIIAALALVAGWVAGPRIRGADAPQPLTRAAWKDIYETPDALIDGVDAIVVARHERSALGRTVESDNETEALPFVLQTFTVERVLKGALSDGVEIDIEQTGEFVADGRVTGIDSDGGDYVPGDRYLLFLMAQPGTGVYYVVSYQGRYNVVSGNLFGVHAHDPVAEMLSHQPLDAVTGSIERVIDGGRFGVDEAGAVELAPSPPGFGAGISPARAAPEPEGH